MHIFSDSDLITRKDGSIYHLGILPEDLADTILTVGDPQRVEKVSKYFDRIEIKKSIREFTTHTGYVGNKRITVMSTGMGSSNIEIVMNELDMLINVDLQTKQLKTERKSLDIIRLGTSGAIQADIPCGTIILSKQAFALDGLNQFYPLLDHQDDHFSRALRNSYIANTSGLYSAGYSESLAAELNIQCPKVLTYTAQGFYSPQFRATSRYHKGAEHLQEMAEFDIEGNRISNIEMETAAIYYMSKYFGFRSLSFSAILANRANGKFSSTAAIDVDNLIQNVIQAISNK